MTDLVAPRLTLRTSVPMATTDPKPLRMKLTEMNNRIGSAPYVGTCLVRLRYCERGRTCGHESHELYWLHDYFIRSCVAG